MPLLGGLEALHVARERRADWKNSKPEQQPELRRAHEGRTERPGRRSECRREAARASATSAKGDVGKGHVHSAHLARRAWDLHWEHGIDVVQDDGHWSHSAATRRVGDDGRRRAGPRVPRRGGPPATPGGRSGRDAGGGVAGGPRRPSRAGRDEALGRCRGARLDRRGAGDRRRPATCWSLRSGSASRTGTRRCAPGASSSRRGPCTRCRSTGPTR